MKDSMAMAAQDNILTALSFSHYGGESFIRGAPLTTQIDHKRKIMSSSRIATCNFDRLLQANGNGSEWKELLSNELVSSKGDLWPLFFFSQSFNGPDQKRLD